MPASPQKPPEASTAKTPKPAKPAKEKVLQPWDQRPWPKRGDRSLRTLYAAVGQALSTWEECDYCFTLVFRRLMRQDNEISLEALSAYTSIRVFEGRLNMVKETGRAYLFDIRDTPLAKEFWSVIGDAGNYAGRRNEIAHGMAGPFSPGKPLSIERDEHMKRQRRRSKGIKSRVQYCLYPSFSMGNKHEFFGVPMYAYTSVEIDYYTSCFSALGNRVAGLALAVAEENKRRMKLRSELSKPRAKSPAK